ncbi:MAG: tRNA (adenosine(37)-N6)-dimethylallyltransferase MiaA, partial [Oscillospiraceae bacterium]|nr:tRNA (adenosine(37)-N6)-dimethylallyltransferase MiaA [Oscillospiraceae bacterium]
MKNLPHLLVICGPTATGKTAFAIETALRENGEIVSCDSMQVYRGMDIGTAKATSKEQAAVPHHMIDVASPHTDFSAAAFAKMALPIVEDILARGKLPVLCGGTGYYIDALLQNNFDAPPEDPDFRRSLEGLTNAEIHSRLLECDPKSAQELHPNNRRRVVRALEIFHVS